MSWHNSQILETNFTAYNQVVPLESLKTCQITKTDMAQVCIQFKNMEM